MANYKILRTGLLVVVVVFCSCDSAQAIGASYRNFRNNFVGQNEEGRFYRNSSFIEDPEYALSPQERHLRQSKFFPLFTIIRFTNEVCTTSSEEHGICYTKAQCITSGGQALGPCAQGLGVCCRFIAKCGSIIYHNGTSFQSEGYPSKFNPTDGSNVCQVRIKRPLNACQLRLNFIALEIDGPTPPPTTAGGATTTNDAGSCKTDSFSITSSGGTIPNLCGNMNGQHIYVEFGSSDTITINLLLSGTVQRERVWNIEVLMIPCNSVVRAPAGCLQYFTGISGNVQSFNWQGGVHLANMDYSACIRPEDGMRFIDWTPCTGGDVKISGAVVATAATVPMPCQTTPTAGAGSALFDYITIMGGVVYPPPTTITAPITATTSLADRFCDVTWPQNLNAYVRSSVRPFLIHFKTDGNEIAQAAGATTGAEASAGFCLKWQQNPQ